MKKRVIKIVIGIVLVCLILIGGKTTYLLFTQPISVFKVEEVSPKVSHSLDKVLSEEEIKADIEEIIGIMEETHPIFLEEVPDKYYVEKEQLLSNIGKSMTVGELQYNISKYMSSIDDGHTQLMWNEERFLDIDWKYKDGQLILLDKNKLTNLAVKKVNGIDIEVIIKRVQDTFPDENYIAEERNIERYSKGKLLLESCGMSFSNYITLTLDKDGEEVKKQAEFTRGSSYIANDYGIYSKLIDDDIVYIRIGTCEVNDDLYNVAEDIKRYLEEGRKDFIIDVIDNGGGNSEACSIILESLKITPGSYGGVIRFSPLAQEQHGYLRKSGSIEYIGNNDIVRNDDINLYVLTNEVTFSSAQMLAVWIGDGKLGTLVGRPSSNMPSNYGDILTFQLENSRILGVISYKKWVRPDISRDKERVLEPDIYVEYGDSILQAALEDIRKE